MISGLFAVSLLLQFFTVKCESYLTSSFRGVCISDLIPFYLGKLFRQSGASDDVCSRVSSAYMLPNYFHARGAKPIDSVICIMHKYIHKILYVYLCMCVNVQTSLFPSATMKYLFTVLSVEISQS